MLDKPPTDTTAVLTKDEWTIFVAALAFRVLPTISQLQRRDSRLRAVGLHTAAFTSNIGDEAGRDGRKLYIQLFFDSVHQMSKALHITLPDDIETYEMVYQLITLRKKGITFELPPATQSQARAELLRSRQWWR